MKKKYLRAVLVIKLVSLKSDFILFVRAIQGSIIFPQYWIITVVFSQNASELPASLKYSILAKVLEWAMPSQLQRFLDEMDYLDPFQSGSRPGGESFG